MGLEDPNLLLYPLLAITLVLLFSSLSLALVVLLRSPRTLAVNAQSKEVKRDWECVVQLCEEGSPPGQCSGGRNELTMRPRLLVHGWCVHSFPDFAGKSRQPTSYDLSDDSSPTETCVCVHCFPDMKTLSQGHDRALRAPSSLYSYPVLHRAHVRNGGSVQPRVPAPSTEGGVQSEFIVA